MLSPAPSAPGKSPAKRPRNPDPTRTGFSFGAGWGMLACGLAVGLGVGQFAGHRGVRAELYQLKRDVREVRAAADALTGAAGRGGETTALLADLLAQRDAVRDAAKTWKDAERAMAGTAKPLLAAKRALADAAEVQDEAYEVLAAADAVRGGVLDDAEGWSAAAAAARDAAAAQSAVLATIAADRDATRRAADAAGDLADLRDAVLAGRESAPAAESTLRRMLAVQRRLTSERDNAAAARAAAAETAAAHRDLIAEQRSALAAARVALSGLKRLSAEAGTVSAEAADATDGLRAAAVALADLSALKQMVAAAGADFPRVWRSLDALFTLRDTLLAEDPRTARLAAGPAGDAE